MHCGGSCCPAETRFSGVPSTGEKNAKKHDSGCGAGVGARASDDRLRGYESSAGERTTEGAGGGPGKRKWRPAEKRGRFGERQCGAGTREPTAQSEDRSSEKEFEGQAP